MNYKLNTYKLYGNNMTFMWKDIDGITQCERLKDIKVIDIEYMVNNKFSIIVFSPDEDKFILEDELFNRRVRKIT